MKVLWAGLALLMSISSAQSCQIDSKFDPFYYANSADTVLIGDISQYKAFAIEKHGIKFKFAKFFVTPKQLFSGVHEDPFWAVWWSTVRFSPPSQRPGTSLIALRSQSDPHGFNVSKEVLQDTVGNDFLEVLQDLCYPESAIFHPHSPEAQAIIEVLGKQTEAEQ
ncbi:hypothetical protein [Pseudovibrio sp. Alg231-02]|uniref:hypothetical protein n=1 Tax=Pseudovibrio sp. Alg231-02 TaxID=1922223 RepID=UPI000D54FE78|nr:hypothetical protein [Pseudovibrio sp. Alg231-02]